jgi:heme/copper-type cytochrome/quinol oxidase subunit 1
VTGFLEWSTSDLLLIVVAAAAMIGTVLWLVPSKPVPRKSSYTHEEITAYDRQIPRYFLAAAIAMLVGGIHTVVKNVPGFWQWEWEAGYGGHLFRDLANSHILIVGGGTVLLTGLTWYVLPRWTNRPLYSQAMATASFWFTVIGVFGFYISWLILGLVEGQMVREGWDYLAAKESLGAAHTVPTRITSTIMGVGYWAYVLNVVLTAATARSVREKPFGYLVRFAVVAALGLWIGTVQGVLQVLPANADWIHLAGRYGSYVDPISHAHVNLVTGMIVSLAALLVFFSGRLGGRTLGASEAKLLFWTLVPGSLAFYLVFLLLGLILGGDAVGYGGIQAPSLVPAVETLRPFVLALSGIAMLAGFWVYFFVMWRAASPRGIVGQVREGSLPAFWLVSSFALVVGTFQGLLQVIPATAHYLTIPEEIPNIHAQLNMVGGVLLALIGLVYLVLPDFVGRPVEPRFVRQTLWGLGGGIFAYYLATLLTGMLRLGYLQNGYTDAEAAAELGVFAPALLMLTALPMCWGYLAFARGVFRATRAYRAELAEEWRAAPSRFTGPLPARVRRIPTRYILGMEFLGACFGWPGLGWLYAGQALPAVFLMLVGPGIAWALLPSLFATFADGPLGFLSWRVVLVWLAGSATLSASLLALYLKRSRAAERARTAGSRSPTSRPPTAPPQTPERPARPAEAAFSRRVPRRLIVGAAAVFLVLFSVPLVPLLAGLPGGTSGEQPLMGELPERANGAYLQVADDERAGLLKLFTWKVVQDDLPSEASAVNPAHFSGILIRQKGLDEPAKYQLFDMDTGLPVELGAEVVEFQHELRLVPAQPLAAGSYFLKTPTGGMFAGQDYYYFRLDPTITTAPPLAGEVERVSNPLTPAWLLDLFPVAAAAISGTAAAVMLHRQRQRARAHELAWAAAFSLFALAAGSKVAADQFGWSSVLVKFYYVAGATLVVGWLALGTWLLVVRRPILRQAGVWTMLALSGFAAGSISGTPVDQARLASEGWHALEKPLPLTALTLGLNAGGTVILVGGALWSAWVFRRRGLMRKRMQGCLLLAVGALIVALGGTLTRLGSEQYFYIAMSIGVGLMFWGYLKTIRPSSPSPFSRMPGEGGQNQESVARRFVPLSRKRERG